MVWTGYAKVFHIGLEETLWFEFSRHSESLPLSHQIVYEIALYRYNKGIEGAAVTFDPYH